MTPVRVVDVSGILARHGIDPDADADTLMAALEGRGWLVTIEAPGIGRPQRYTTHTTRADENPRPDSFGFLIEGAGFNPTVLALAACQQALAIGMVFIPAFRHLERPKAPSQRGSRGWGQSW